MSQISGLAFEHGSMVLARNQWGSDSIDLLVVFNILIILNKLNAWQAISTKRVCASSASSINACGDLPLACAADAMGALEVLW
ncbi:MAG TPA: hypothetical protein VMV48_14990 [Gallionellaceae bacterium]|nr:hypothetical protein [Gallionellaceae bacterium]